MNAKPIPIEKLSTLDIERFWSKVDKTAGPTGCWPWVAGRDKDGYGKFQIGRHRAQTHLRAHRVALALATASSALETLHSCDFPPCCNPAHLRGGTLLDNVRERVAKNRSAHGEKTRRKTAYPRGEAHPLAVITAETARIIKAKYIPKPRPRGSIATIARELGVSTDIVSNIWDRGNWGHV